MCVVSCTFSQILSVVYKNEKESRDHKHAPLGVLRHAWAGTSYD